MSIYHKIAARHVPDRQLQGDGAWLLLSECAPDLPLMPFALESARKATLGLWNAHGCGAPACTGKHVQKTIKPRPSYCWEQDRD